MTDKMKLLPCPFCGSPASLEQDNDHHGEWFNLGCSRHYGAVRDANEGCPGGRIWYTEDPSNLDRAVAQWNARAAPSSPGDGWVMVPREPTSDMKTIGWTVLQQGLDEHYSASASLDGAYRAMLSAAPSPGGDHG